MDRSSQDEAVLQDLPNADEIKSVQEKLREDEQPELQAEVPDVHPPKSHQTSFDTGVDRTTSDQAGPQETYDDTVEALPEDLVEDTPALRSQIINLALPALIEQTLMTLVSMADMIMVGRLGPWAITAVGLSNQPMFVAMSVFIALNVGATALVARFVGAGEPEEASKVARQALMIAVIMGFILAVIGLSSAGGILHFMGAEEDVIGPGTEYLRVVCMGLPVWAVSISLTAALRGAGDTRTPMTVNIVANLVNVVGNYLLIYGHLGLPRLGVKGAGVATTISRAVACALMLSKVIKGDKVIKISRGDSFKFDSGIIKRILNVGIPAALEQVVMRSGQMTFARIVSSFGTITYAAHQIAINIEGFSFTPGFSFSIASTTLVGQCLGAKNPDRAERVGWEAVRIGAFTGIATGIVYFFFGKYFAYLYTDDATVMALAAGALKIIALVQPFMLSNFILMGGLRGAGDTRWTLYITMAGFWGLRVVTAYLLAIKMGMGLYGAWIGMALDMVGRATLAGLRFRAGGWKHTRV
ncbi:MAG TPA: MATE family efflux transporter [Firmicutes bacterium]|nr:MATE family efflux transporter [Candidatus Fermentithermobacillaceae bacterium]